MPVYFANPTKAGREAMDRRLIGAIATPAQGNLIDGIWAWVADNGCFGKGYPGDAEYLGWLDAMAVHRDRCWLATAPDVVGDAAATLARSGPFLPEIRARGYPAALVAQDGLEDLTVPWDSFDVLFIGGTTAFKLGAAARRLAGEARSRGKPVHMGRVNSGKRFRYAAAIGCTSVDGTMLIFDPVRRLDELLGWDRAERTQLTMFGGDAA